MKESPLNPKRIKLIEIEAPLNDSLRTPGKSGDLTASKKAEDSFEIEAPNAPHGRLYLKRFTNLV